VLFLAAALSAFLLVGEIRFVQAALGFLLLFVQETTKADLLRLAIFAWVAFSLVMVAIAAIANSAWLAILPTFLFGGGIVALMLEGMSRRQITIYSGASVAGLIMSWLI